VPARRGAPSARKWANALSNRALKISRALLVCASFREFWAVPAHTCGMCRQRLASRSFVGRSATRFAASLAAPLAKLAHQVALRVAVNVGRNVEDLVFESYRAELGTSPRFDLEVEAVGPESVDDDL
jgi:hypothetical protein